MRTRKCFDVATLRAAMVAVVFHAAILAVPITLAGAVLAVVVGTMLVVTASE